MGVADTSLEAYINKVLPSLSEKRTKVLSIYFDNPEESFTNAEVSQILGWMINRVTPRRHELVRFRILEKKQKRECRVTGNTAWAIGLTDKGKYLRIQTLQKRLTDWSAHNAVR